MRRIDSYIQKYGPAVGPKLYRTMQSRAAYAGVSARLRKKIAGLKAGAEPASGKPADGPMATQALLPLSAGEELAEVGPAPATA
jgi:hypothetical protein